MMASPPDRFIASLPHGQITRMATHHAKVGTYVHESHPAGLAVYSYPHMPIGSLADATRPGGCDDDA